MKKSELKQLIKESLREQFKGYPKDLGTLHLFRDTPTYVSYLAPGPLSPGGNGDFVINVKSGTLSVGEGGKRYAINVYYNPTTKIAKIGARPNNAVGSGLLFEEFENQNPQDFINLASQFKTAEDVQNYYTQFLGERPVYAYNK